MMLKDSGDITDSAKTKYLCTLLRGEALHQLDTFCVEAGSTTTTHLNRIILGLGTYFFPIYVLSNKNHAMRRGMRKPKELKVIRYAAHIIELN